MITKIVRWLTKSDKTLKKAKQLKADALSQAEKETRKIRHVTVIIKNSTSYDIARAMGVVK